MREIKFRAWNIDEQYMHSNIEDGIYCDPDEVLGFDSILGLASYKVMQYTGLSDMNGKEIYEGDILKGGILHLTGGRKISNEDVATMVTYQDGMFKLGGVSLLSFHRRAEVIGNIYENPDLV